MNKIKLVLLTVVLFLFFHGIGQCQQQIDPPHKGWNKVYEDTLGYGTAGTVYSWTNSKSLGGVFVDTTKYIDWKHLWGAMTLWVNLDSVTTGYDAAACTLYYQIHNDDKGSQTDNTAYAEHFDETADFNLIETIPSAKAGGSVYINVSKDNTSHWSKSHGGRLYIVTTDTMKVTIWTLKH